MGDNYKEKQNSSQCGMGNIVHTSGVWNSKNAKSKLDKNGKLKATGAAYARPQPADQRMTPREKQQHRNKKFYTVSKGWVGNAWKKAIKSGDDIIDISPIKDY